MTDMPPSDPRLVHAAKIHHLTQRLFCALAIDNGWTEENQDVLLDANAAMEALLYLLALIIEADPELATSRDLRLTCERAADQLKKMVKTARGHSERTGEHSITMFGAFDAFAVPDEAPH